MDSVCLAEPRPRALSPNVSHDALLRDVSGRLLPLKRSETGTQIIRPSVLSPLSRRCYTCRIHGDVWVPASRKMSGRLRLREGARLFHLCRSEASLACDPGQTTSLMSLFLLFCLRRFVTAAANRYATAMGSKVSR